MLGYSMVPTRGYGLFSNKIASGGGGYNDYCGSLTLTGTYHTSEYVTDSGCAIASNVDNGEIAIVIRGAINSSYENVEFYADSLPSGVSLVTSANHWQADSNVYLSYAYCCILTGVTEPLNITCDFSALDSTYDYVRCDVSASAASSYGSTNYCGTLSITGDYSGEVYITAAGCRIAGNSTDEKMIIVIQSGYTTAYEKIEFAENSLPSGVSLDACDARSLSNSTPIGQYYCCILTGVTEPLDITCDASYRNSTGDYVRCYITAVAAA